MSVRRAIVDGKHGTQKRVFLIRGARVVKERSVDSYLKYGWSEMTTMGHWNGEFHWK